MRVTDVDVAESARGATITGTVVWESHEDEPEPISFLYRDLGAEALSAPGDVLATSVWMPAMARGEDVTVDAPVSATLTAGLEEVAEVWTRVMPRWRRPSFSAPR